LRGRPVAARASPSRTPTVRAIRAGVRQEPRRAGARSDTSKTSLAVTRRDGVYTHALMDRAFRLVFLLVVRPAGVIVRRRDPLRLRRPNHSNYAREWRGSLAVPASFTMPPQLSCAAA